MSQQEFQSQAEDSKQWPAEEEVYARPLPRSNKKKAMPKSEHPSTYEETIPPYSYRAQDTREPGQKQTSQTKQQARRQGFSPDGDAFETGYRPYQIWAQRIAPSWSRPRQRGAGRLVFLIIVAIILLPILFKVLTFLLAALAIVVASFLFFALIAVAIVAMIFFALRRSLRWPRRTMWRW